MDSEKMPITGPILRKHGFVEPVFGLDVYRYQLHGSYSLRVENASRGRWVTSIDCRDNPSQGPVIRYESDLIKLIEQAKTGKLDSGDGLQKYMEGIYDGMEFLEPKYTKHDDYMDGYSSGKLFALTEYVAAKARYGSTIEELSDRIGLLSEVAR